MNMRPLRITLRQLQYIVAIADKGSFQKAAQDCHVSQPSLSAQVAVAEDALGVQLFERKVRPILVTPAGIEIVEAARAVLAGGNDIELIAQRHRDPLGGELRLGVIPTIAPYLLPTIDPVLRTEYPRLSLFWVEDKTEHLVEKIKRGVLDGAVVALEADLADLDHLLLGHDEFVLALPISHRLANSTSPVKLDELVGERLMLLDDGHCFRSQALELCTSAGVSEMRMRATSMATLAQMVSGGAGVTLMPEMSLARENASHRFAHVPFQSPVPGRTIVLAYRNGSPVAPVLAKIANTVRPLL